MLLLRPGSTRWEPAPLELRDGTWGLEVDGKGYAAPVLRADGGLDHAAALAELAKLAAADGLALKGCASCIRFRSSGMARQMSDGRRGYCTLVGFRNPEGLVDADFVSGEHEPAPGWPADLAAAEQARLELSAREPTPSRQDAYEGCLVGLAVGDALGMPVEFLRRSEILRKFGPDGVTDFASGTHPAGTYSDDTQMTLAVAEGLLDVPGGDVEAVLRAISARFVAWLHDPANDRAPGTTCLAGCRNLEAGRPWREAGVAGSKGCGTAMRAAPIGLLFARDTPLLLEVARASALPTHGHDAAVEGAAAAALLVALALRKRTPRQMYDALLAECAPRSVDFRACLEKLPGLVEAEPEVALSRRGLGEGWVAEEAVVSALYCFWRSPADFARTVLTAVNTDGDSDSIATIAGSISGAFNGAGAIPRAWREGVEGAEGLARTASRLWEARR